MTERDCIIYYSCLIHMLTDVEVENEESRVEHSSLSLSR